MAGKSGGGRRLAFIEPQLAVLVETPPRGDDWLHEIKLDGYRTQLIVEAGHARALTRRGFDWSDRYRPVVDAAASLPVQNAIIDGEMVAFAPDGRATIEAFRKASAEELVFVAFDLLHLNGKDLRTLRCIERRRLLHGILPQARGGGGAIQFSEHLQGDGEAFYDHVCRLGFEGMVSKRAASPYRSGETDGWAKTKCFEETALLVAGIQREPGKASFAIMASPDDGRYVGSAFIALGNPALRDLLYQLAEEGGGSAPAGYKVKKRFPAEWIAQRLLGRVKHLRGEETLRHARLVGLVGDGTGLTGV